MEKLKVIFRKDKNPVTNKYEVIAFFPEIEVNYGNIMSYMHVGQHGEASYEYYLNTKKATEEEYKPLLKELKGIYIDYILNVKQRINHNDLVKAWTKVRGLIWEKVLVWMN